MTSAYDEFQHSSLLDQLPPPPASEENLDRVLEWMVEVGRVAPVAGSGQTEALWDLLAGTAAQDVTTARVLEPHLDALSILAQVPDGVDLGALGADADSTWGVFAAEGPGVRLSAREEPGRWRLDGTKPWCSLAQQLSHALVTAWTPDGRRLFAVDLRADGVQPEPGPWVARGLRQVISAPVQFEDVTAVPVGPTGWYLTRPGFAWGGIGVAACWWGGALGVGREMMAAARERENDQIGLAHLGAVDAALWSARAVLREAAALVDDPPSWLDSSILARRCRQVAARCVEEVLERSAHARGPAPLALDETHARRTADLALYVRQHHAERDEASLGRDLLARAERLGEVGTGINHAATDDVETDAPSASRLGAAASLRSADLLPVGGPSW